MDSLLITLRAPLLEKIRTALLEKTKTQKLPQKEVRSFFIVVVNPTKKYTWKSGSEVFTELLHTNRWVLCTHDVTYNVKQHLCALIAANGKKTLQKVNINSLKETEATCLDVLLS